MDPTVAAQSATTIMTYTATNPAAMQDPQGHVTTYSYDAAGRTTGAVNGAGQQTSYGYDNAGNLTGVTVGNPASPSSTIAETYDALNQPVSQTVSGPNLPGALVTTYSYDLHGHLVRLQAANNDTSFGGYDLADQLVNQELDPGAPNTPTGAHRESFSYDAAGNRVGSTDFRGGSTQMTLDGDNRQTGQIDSFAGTSPITSTAGFDPDGNLVGQLQLAGSQSHSFSATLNPADWPQSVTNDTLTSSSTGAGRGDVLAQTIQNGAGKVSYNIDQAGRDNQIGVLSVGGTTPLTTTFAFNNNEQMTAEALPNNVEQDAAYDAANRLVSLTAQNTTNHALLNNSYQYGYDLLGLTNGITTTVQGTPSNQSLTHDAAGRLTAVSGAGPTGSWSYDGRGNLTSATSTGVTKSYSYATGNPEEAVSTSVSGQPTTYYGYDAAGDTTSITNTGSLKRQLSYDAQARLVQVTLGSPITQTVALSYNAFGQRSGYSVTPAGAGQPSLSESFKYQGDQLSQVATTGTGITTPYTDTYVYTQDGTPLELLRQTASGTTPYWYVLDGQSNVVALTNGAGSVVDSYSYDQWGKLTNVSESVPQQLRYAGYWYDNELGWYWLSVRAYDPALGRFLQPDPSEMEGLFSYVYAGDNPSDLGDASGLIATPPQFGCLVSSAGTPFECNVAVGSDQWNYELAHGNYAVGGTLGAQLAQVVPSICGNRVGVCLVSIRTFRGAFGAEEVLCFSCAVGAVGSALGSAAGFLGNGIHVVCDATLCGDVDAIQHGAWYMKILGTADIVITLVPVGDLAEKGAETAIRIGAGLSERQAVEEVARFAETLARDCITMCFSAGTKVATPHGDIPIERVQVGDQVLTENPETGKVEAETVQAVLHDPPTWVMAITLADGSTIEVTPEHPFWVDRGTDFAGPGWLQAGELRIGDQLRTANGADATVVSLRYRVAKVAVYTLMLGQNHDFFVGSARLLVHNCDPARIEALGTDPIKKEFSIGEANIAAAVEARTKVVLTRDPSGRIDWFDRGGRSYDAVGPLPATALPHFNLDKFTATLKIHVGKADFVPLDVTGLTEDQKFGVLKYIIEKLPENQQKKIIGFGF